MSNLVERLEGRLLFSASILPRPDHVVVLVEEDHSYGQILGAPSLPPSMWAVQPAPLVDQAPHLRQLAGLGASFTHASSVGNNNFVDYQAIFSGYVPKQLEAPFGSPLTDPNLASELNAAGLSFGGYAESLPHVGYSGADVGAYTRSHNPWVEFANVPASENLPFAKFPHDYNKLPTVSYVVPNEFNNMHSGTIQQADDWYQANIAPYARWAMSHNSLLIVTWDESHVAGDPIPTLFYGPMVEQGQYSEHITQANILRTIEDMYGLPLTGRSAQASPITDVFESVGQVSAERPRRAAVAVHTARIIGSVQVGAAGHRHGSGWTVYLDVNNDGISGPDEPHVRTGPGGRFIFRHLAAGTYVVRLRPRPGYATAPGTSDSFTFNIVTGQTLTGAVFSEVPVA